MKHPGRLASVLWLAAVLACALIARRAHYTADLSAFLPRSPSASQRLLMEQLREGPAGRLVVLAIAGGDAATRAQLSRALAARLGADPALHSVSNGDTTALEHDREFLFRNRYLLSPQVSAEHFSAQGLHTAIADSLDTLATPAGVLAKPLFPVDPTGELLAIVGDLATQPAPDTAGGVWASRDGARALLAVQLRAAGSDTDAQQAACAHIRAAFEAARSALPAAARAGLALQMSGPPVFAVQARALVKQQVLRLSSVSSLLIAVLLLYTYRSWRALLLGLVPVASGALAGVAAVACGFGVVHGVTLGFGVTLIGEAVDYSIYLFLQQPDRFRQWVWPTIRLGVLTSICGFAALLPSGFPGLAQLGLYSIAGLTAAALVTRFVLPAWLPQTLRLRDLSAFGARIQQRLAAARPGRILLIPLALLAVAVLFLHRHTLWSGELASMNPVPAAAQALDERLHADLGTPEVRYLLIVSADSREAALARAGNLAARLAPLEQAGVLDGFQSPSRYLPDLATQQARLAAIPPPQELRRRLASALAGLPVRIGVLEPFLAAAQQARQGRPLGRADLAGSSFAAAVDALLFESGGRWNALLPLSANHSADLPDAALAQVRQIAASNSPATQAVLLDLKGESDRLYTGYLSEVVRLALGGGAAIVLLLVLALRSPRRVIATVAPLALAVLTVAAGLAVAGHPLGILHVVGMLLIVAVGSNYALFAGRATPRTLASLVVANLATVTAFAVLASSKVAVLSDLGMTVAPGAFLALWFSALLAPAE